MLYLVELERELELQPRFFGPRLREVLEQKLISEVWSATFSLLRFTDSPEFQCETLIAFVLRWKAHAVESMASSSVSLAWAMLVKGASGKALAQHSSRCSTAAWF